MTSYREQHTQIAAWVDRDFASRFAELARGNERSASAEARLAIRRHLENEVPAAQAANKLAAAGAARTGGVVR